MGSPRTGPAGRSAEEEVYMTEQKDNDLNKLPALQTVRGILEAVIVASLLWVGNTLIDATTKMAVMQTQLASIQTQLADVPNLKVDAIKKDAMIEQLQRQQQINTGAVDELRKVRGLR